MSTLHDDSDFPRPIHFAFAAVIVLLTVTIGVIIGPASAKATTPHTAATVSRQASVALKTPKQCVGKSALKVVSNGNDANYKPGTMCLHASYGGHSYDLAFTKAGYFDILRDGKVEWRPIRKPAAKLVLSAFGQYRLLTVHNGLLWRSGGPQLRGAGIGYNFTMSSGKMLYANHTFVLRRDTVSVIWHSGRWNGGRP